MYIFKYNFYTYFFIQENVKVGWYEYYLFWKANNCQLG